jgi:anthranilate phosphoribosyltransferase
MSAIRAALTALASGRLLSEADATAAFGDLLDGTASEIEIAGLLMGLRARGETVAEIVGAARAMRARVAPLVAPLGVTDTCGTGGDGQHTFNISTAAAIVAAGAGTPIAKHGNRAVSSSSGSSDVLSALGVAVETSPEGIAACFAEAGMAFLFAPSFHAAVRHAAPVRRALGVRTVFNLLGPLCNPARASRQVLGVWSPDWLAPMAEALRELGASRAWVVHGRDGLDELTVCADSEVAALDPDGRIHRFTVSPEDVGLPRSAPDALKGGDAAHNARALHSVLAGERSAHRDAVVLNAAAALVVAGRAETLGAGAAQAADAIDSGAAQVALAKLITTSRAYAEPRP